MNGTCDDCSKNCVTFATDEYKGHRLLESAKQADVAHVKKQLATEIVNFKHPFTGETALVLFFTVLWNPVRRNM